MNRLFCLTLLFLFTFSGASFAQKNFTGKIIYQITYPGANLSEDETQMLPNEMTLTISDDYLKTSLPSKLGATEIIFNLKDNSSTALIDNNGNKFAITNEDDNSRENEKAPVVDLTNETKEIAGHQCKLAYVTAFEENGTPRPKVAVYYAEDIQHPGIYKLLPELKGLPGFPLEYEIKGGDISQKLQAIRVHRHKVSDNEFKIPAEYEQHQKLEIEHNPDRR